MRGRRGRRLSEIHSSGVTTTIDALQCVECYTSARDETEDCRNSSLTAQLRHRPNGKKTGLGKTEVASGRAAVFQGNASSYQKQEGETTDASILS